MVWGGFTSHNGTFLTPINLVTETTEQEEKKLQSLLRAVGVANSWISELGMLIAQELAVEIDERDMDELKQFFIGGLRAA